MKRREVFLLVAGLIVGLVLGILIEGEASLYGTAGDKDKEAVDFYLVELDAAESWLVEKYPDSSEKVEAALRTFAPSDVPLPIPPSVVAAEEDVKFLLRQSYAALIGAEDIESMKVKDGDGMAACFGVDDDPYEGQTVYLYLTIPSDEVEKMDVPKEWEKLEKSKDRALYWEFLACFPDLAS